MLKLSSTALSASMALLASLVVLGGCAQMEEGGNTAPELGDPNYLRGVDTRSDELYINKDGPAGARDFRNVYVAQADLTIMQIIQPEGEIADAGWQVTRKENEILQATIKEEFTRALGYQSAYNIVDDIGEAEIVVNTTVVALHPNATWADVKSGATPGGAVTVSIALVNGAGGDVMIRSVDTKSTDDIWAFHQVENNDPGLTLIFRSWGNSIRRGMLQLQGRSNDPLAPVIQLEQQ